LDEIGVKLNLTPEYLGTLFHKEIGMTFSNYMKNYRIGKARELLCGTQLKLYEIAQQVGYADPKYFSKVFKEVTGQLPGEYRKTYK
jgi:two-component system response regulator YesN